MSDFNWCHGPYCHESQTVDRVRGVKGSKVLRTRKIPINTWNRETIWRLFCSQGCLMEFVNKHSREMIALEPRTEPLETPIEDPKKETHNSGYYSYNNWTIKVDESRQT
tara:strand:- start:14 stop:340 length:327 start_codon:yes stop_codon:yes gene_type:complete